MLSEGLSSEKRKHISGKNAERLSISTTSLDAVLKSVINRSVKLGDFEYLAGHEDKLVQLCEVTDELKDPTQQAVLRQAFAQRTEERQAYLEFHSQLSDLFSVCQPYIRGICRS